MVVDVHSFAVRACGQVSFFENLGTQSFVTEPSTVLELLDLDSPAFFYDMNNDSIADLVVSGSGLGGVCWPFGGCRRHCWFLTWCCFGARQSRISRVRTWTRRPACK